MARGDRKVRVRALLVALAVLAVAVVLAACGSDDKKADDQTVTFETASSTPDDPFTEPVDVSGPETVGGGGSSGGSSTTTTEGQGPFGGSGSDKVCDRDLLIRSLTSNPDKMRAWAGVLGIEPTKEAVTKYIAKLHPVTLTRDTRVTNHTFENGKAIPLQSILEAGTTVLVDEHGKPVVRCRCGNPLTEPEPIKQAKCHNCPPNYKPPPPCKYYDDDYDFGRFYPRDDYSNSEYDKIFIQSGGGPYKDCYIVYPKPPEVTIVDVFQSKAEPDVSEEEEQEGETVAPEVQTQTQTTPTPETQTTPQDQGGNTYCYEADSPDRFEPGCQGTYGPPPNR